jgi:hypothetical protein
MRGYIAVFKPPFFAATERDGGFDLSNLPPGTYTIKAWHKKLGTSTQTATLGPNESNEIHFVCKGMELKLRAEAPCFLGSADAVLKGSSTTLAKEG